LKENFRLQTVWNDVPESRSDLRRGDRECMTASNAASARCVQEKFLVVVQGEVHNAVSEELPISIMTLCFAENAPCFWALGRD